MRRLPILGAAVALAITVAAPASALDPVDTSALEKKVGADTLAAHLAGLQAIANKSDGNRASGTIGFTRSVDYVFRKLKLAGYSPKIQRFTAFIFEEYTVPSLFRTSPDRKRFTFIDDYYTMEFSGSGDVKGRLVLAGGILIPPGPDPSSSSSGCTAEDFPASTAGAIVLIQRGTCDFGVKAMNAEAAGAIGAIIFNEGQEGRTDLLVGTLGAEVGIPVTGTTFAVGEELYNNAQAGPVRMRMIVDGDTYSVDSANVLADLPGTRDDRVVVVGAHLDSVDEGPGINDNGTGTATNLTIAEGMKAAGITPRNTVRFAFWGAEEQGLYGSQHYVDSASLPTLSRIMLNLNFDMLGSPNYIRMVYDGSGDVGPIGPPGSEIIEQVFVDYYASRGLATKPTAFDGRSDYFGFINIGIPAGGLFSGAEEIKTPEEAEIYGGEAGVAYDECYHAACDTVENVNPTGLEELAKGAAHSVLTFAMTTQDIREGAKQSASAKAAISAIEYRGNKLVR